MFLSRLKSNSKVKSTGCSLQSTQVQVPALMWWLTSIILVPRGLIPCYDLCGQQANMWYTYVQAKHSNTQNKINKSLLGGSGARL